MNMLKKFVSFLRKWRARMHQVVFWVKTYGLPWSRTPFFPFIRPHHDIDDAKLAVLQKRVVTGEEGDCSSTYALAFCTALGGGYALPTASARMALHALLRHYGLGNGDEVLVTGFTCSVVLNAVLRCGAVPRFVDIDRHTMGTSPESVESAITPRTKALIAQHTFGVPCAIDSLRALATQHHIKLIEDVAIAFGSKYQGKPLGAWGDAAYFSTDHSKPLNSLIGGMLYTTDENLYERIFSEYQDWPHLPREKQQALLEQVRVERDNFTPARYRWHNFAALFVGREAPSPFLDADYTPWAVQGDYPYPAKMPAVLTSLGHEALRQWHVVANERRHWFKKISEVFYRNNCQGMIPVGFQNIGEEVVPLRFAFCLPAASGPLRENKRLWRAVNAFFPASWIWFQEPVVCRTTDIAAYGYTPGTCPVAEEVGRGIVTIPLDVPSPYSGRFMQNVENLCRELQALIRA